jgi:hypothetical protein
MLTQASGMLDRRSNQIPAGCPLSTARLRAELMNTFNIRAPSRIWRPASAGATARNTAPLINSEIVHTASNSNSVTPRGTRRNQLSRRWETHID